MELHTETPRSLFSKARVVLFKTYKTAVKAGRTMLDVHQPHAQTPLLQNPPHIPQPGPAPGHLAGSARGAAGCINNAGQGREVALPLHTK